MKRISILIYYAFRLLKYIIQSIDPHHILSQGEKEYDKDLPYYILLRSSLNSLSLAGILNLPSAESPAYQVENTPSWVSYSASRASSNRRIAISGFSARLLLSFLYKQRQNDIMNGSMLPYNDKEQPNYP